MFDKLDPQDVALFKLSPEQAREELVNRFCLLFRCEFPDKVLAARAAGQDEIYFSLKPITSNNYDIGRIKLLASTGNIAPMLDTIASEIEKEKGFLEENTSYLNLMEDLKSHNLNARLEAKDCYPALVISLKTE